MGALFFEGTGLDEQGVAGLSRVHDYQNPAIVAGDLEFRTATLDYLCHDRVRDGFRSRLVSTPRSRAGPPLRYQKQRKALANGCQGGVVEGWLTLPAEESVRPPPWSACTPPPA
jgi:hypothetical protein